jgi:hypothetical protein
MLLSFVIKRKGKSEQYLGAWEGLAFLWVSPEGDL